LLLGFFSLPFALFMLLGSFVLVFVMPLVAVLVNSARQLRAKQLASQAYDTALDDISGPADWTFSQRHDDFMQRNLAPMREIDACNAAIAASNRRRDFVGQLIFLLLAAAVLFWAAAHFGQMPQAAAPSGDLSRPSDWIAAFVLGFFPLLDAFAPLPAAAIQTNAYLDSVERMNALPQVDGGDRGASPLGAGALARISLEPLPLRGTAAATTCEDTAGTSPERDSLCVEHASFAYAGGDPVLQDVSIDFAPGSRTAILGPSGAGKSTLLRLLRGDYSPTAGSVTLDGVPTSQLGDATPWHIAVMQQHNHLFNQSLLANLRLGKPDATEQEATAALEAAGLGALIPKLPEGLKTVMGEEGTRFSGGEGQRIALARILLQDAPVVLLDEPFASLDPLTEHELLDTVLRMLAGKTIIMVTHHLMGIEQMDQVIFLDNGRITMQGAPDQLATSNAQFRELLSLDRGLLL
ncbi:MAG: ATP-binding cassette domain-containing protein, partial [Coriobacteriales bacterium]|nr:ATP-binding cassette domain-containing protein [Coriobacteriales bacterium]